MLMASLSVDEEHSGTREFRSSQTDSYVEGTTFISFLRTCAKTKDLHTGVNLHADILRRGLIGKNPFVTNSLISMYAKCGALTSAKEVHDSLSVRNVATWNALIAGHAQQAHGKEALNCFEHMQQEGVVPNAVTFICVLKACGSMGALNKGEFVHSEIMRCRLLDGNVVLGGALVDMYVKCGALTKAKDVLQRLPVQNTALWNVLISGYAKEEDGEEALRCFECMQIEGISSDEITFACTLKACGSMGALDKGKMIHFEMVRQGLPGGNTVLATALADMYAKCGAFIKAREVLEGISTRDVVSWNVLITGYVRVGCGKEALYCFVQMQHEGLSPNAATFICILKACACMGAIDEGKKVHFEIVQLCLLDGNTVLGNALLDMYAKCGSLVNARNILDSLSVRNVLSWSALIAGYVQEEHGKETLNCFEQMQYEGLLPDAVIYSCVLQACGSIGALDTGEFVHFEIFRQKLLYGNIVLDNALVDMYAKCGALEKAKEVLEALPTRDVVSWNSLIAGYVQGEHCMEALDCFEQMQFDGLAPDSTTFVCILKACGSIRALDKGENIHSEIVRQVLLGKSVVLGGALVDMYARCGVLTKAKEVLEGLPDRDVASWNALVAGYLHEDYGKEALNSFEQMEYEGVSPDVISFICALTACGHIGAVGKGRNIHTLITSQELLIGNVVLGGALVDMYSKCGVFAKAKEVLEDLPIRNVILWNALIAGYALGDHAKEALNCFEQLQCEGIFPNETTFLSVLNACSHSGLLNEGRDCFTRMSMVCYGIVPKAKHHACMINLFSRMGLVENAIMVIENICFHNDPLVLLALLSACKKWGNLKLGKLIFEHTVQSNTRDAMSYPNTSICS